MTCSRARLLLGLAVALVVLSLRAADQSVIQAAGELELSGKFKEASALLRKTLLQPGVSESIRKELEFELDRLDRIKKDFPLTQETLFEQLQKRVQGLIATEFESWVNENRFDSREIDGERRFMVSSASNLFWRYPELSSRRLPPKDTSVLERKILESCRLIKAAVAAEGKPFVLPKLFEVRMNVVAEAGAAPAGETIRAWLPIPREYSFQGAYRLLSSSAPVLQTAPASSAIRSVYLEQCANSNAPTEFQITYRYEAFGVWFGVVSDRVRVEAPAAPEPRQFVREAPHIEFTPEMRALAKEIGGSEVNPYLKAKKFYEWISENIKYSFAIEYSTIRNIGEYCRSRGYGDCGQEALLFMTLCRLSGIPARWQSGWNTFPGGKSIHDWTEIYLQPYGWIPVDPYMGIFAMRYAQTLSPKERREIRDFYFGGLDQYRMIANSDHSQKLTPPKQSMRSDTVDFQRGELEWGDHNIYFDKFSYDLEVKEVRDPAKVE